MSKEDILEHLIAEDQKRMLLETSSERKSHNGVEYAMVLERLAVDAMQKYADQETARLREQLEVAKEAIRRMAELSILIDGPKTIAAETLKQLSQ